MVGGAATTKQPFQLSMYAQIGANSIVKNCSGQDIAGLRSATVKWNILKYWWDILHFRFTFILGKH